MINFTIKDEVGNIVYNRIDDENQLTDEEIKQIYDALSNLETNMVEFSLSKQQTNDNSYISYQSSRRCGKSEMLKQCKELCEEYNRQVAALPVCHPLEHGATGVRESVGSVDSEEPVDSVGSVDSEEPVDSVDSEEPVDSVDSVDSEEPVDSESPDESDRAVKPDDRGFVSAPTLRDMLSSEDEVQQVIKAISKVLKRNEFYYERPYTWSKEIAKDCEDMVGDLRYNTSTFKGYCGDYNQQKLIDETLSTIPGTYVGCGKHERCEKPNKRAEQEEQCNKEECTETCKIEDFIDFLNTYDSWATLLQELQFHSENKTPEKKTELISKYKKWSAKDNSD